MLQKVQILNLNSYIFYVETCIFYTPDVILTSVCLYLDSSKCFHLLMTWPPSPISCFYFPPILFLLPSHMTKECECHGHSDSCHFSLRAWRSSGRTSGGVCDNCRHNTEGRRCHRCRHGYHRHISLPLKSPHACTRKGQDVTWAHQKRIIWQLLIPSWLLLVFVIILFTLSP